MTARLIWTLLASPQLLALYLAGYAVHRQIGPVERHLPYGGGPPQLLISAEPPVRKAFYEAFRPCVQVEDLYLRIVGRGKYPGEFTDAPAPSDSRHRQHDRH
jgi:hypothetical protein